MCKGGLRVICGANFLNTVAFLFKCDWEHQGKSVLCFVYSFFVTLCGQDGSLFLNGHI